MKLKYYIPLLLIWVQAVALNAAEKPNIILILADDLGYGEIGAFGQKWIQTPTLDRMAKHGLILTDHYSGSTVCAPSRCALLTGKHMGHAKIRGNGTHSLGPEDNNFAKELKKAGYQTAIIGKWDSGVAGSTGEPSRQGFDYSFGYLHQIDAHNFYPDHLWRNGERVELPNEVIVADRGYAKGRGTVATKREVYSHDLFMEESLQWIEQNKENPFLLFLAVTIPHANNEYWMNDNDHGMEVPDLGPYEDRDWPLVQKAHASMVTRMDRGIGEILQKLRDLGIAENTIVMFTSDNGPHEEGGNQHEFFDANGPLQGIKRDLYEGGIRVPFVAYWPGTIFPSTVSRHASAHWDYLPTFCELAGLPVPEDINGISLVPTFLGKPQPAHEYLYWEFMEREGAQAIRWGNWKAIRNLVNNNGFDSAIEIYDLSTDIGEIRNLAYDRPDLVQHAKELMRNARVPSPLFKFRSE
jgi:arylsulfatase A-like enzyme